jgi:hypothetical protein
MKSTLSRRITAALCAITFALGMALGPAAQAKGDFEPDKGAAVVLSLMFSGAGEWYNSGFEGGFPLVECILGKICVCVAISSAFDAAAGKKGDKMRINFWSAPNV